MDMQGLTGSVVALVTPFNEDGSVALDHEEFPRPQTTAEGLAGLEASFTKIADMKVTMLAEATKDARKRAEMIAKNAGNSLGSLKYADQGVIQITPLYSNEVSDYGMNDTYSLEKEITAIVHCEFEIN